MNTTFQTIFDLMMMLLDKHPELAAGVRDAAAKRVPGGDGGGIVNLHQKMPFYAPVSNGDADVLSQLTLLCANQFVPQLWELTRSSGRPMAAAPHPADFVRSRGHAPEGAEELGRIFTAYGSDKATYHNYYILYDYMLADRAKVERVFEIGLGTNNTDVVSNMTREGKPGASLRAFRDVLPNARIYGADVDRRILFTEDRIETFHVDQTDDATFEALGRVLPTGFDLMIDDGLHSPNANLRSLRFFLPRIKVGGWAVVEDIGRQSGLLWDLVSLLLPANYESTVVRDKTGMWLFAVRRLA